MIPVALLGSAVYLVCTHFSLLHLFDLRVFVQGLQLTQVYLSHEKYLEEARARVRQLEEEVQSLQQERTRRRNQGVPSASQTKSSWWFTHV